MENEEVCFGRTDARGQAESRTTTKKKPHRNHSEYVIIWVSPGALRNIILPLLNGVFTTSNP